MGLTRIRAEQISDIDYKQAVRVITLSDVTLSGGAPATVDGVNLSTGNRVLVAGQSTGSQNGLYQVQTVGAGSNGTWIRSSDGNADGEIEAGMIVMVTEGDIYKDTQWKLTTNDPIVIGTTPLVFEQNSAYAFGNIYANGTAVLANAVGGTVSFAAGTNITIVGNNTSKTVTFSAGGGGGTPGGVDTNVQFNDGGSFGGTAGFTFNKTTNAVSTTGTVSATGNVSGGNIIAGTGSGGNISGANIITANAVTTTGNITSGNILTAGLISATGNVTSGNLSTTLVTATTLSATGNVQGGNLRTAGLISATGSITTAGDISITGNIVDGAALTVTTSSNGNITLNPDGSGVVVFNKDLRNGQANGVGNIGTTGGFFNTVFAKATSAQYADVAEKYVADQSYPAGTVLEIGGSAEVRATTVYATTGIAGVVSSHPALIMNSGEVSENAVEVALLGRVPCRVTGTIRRGDLLVASSTSGVATALDPTQYQPGSVIGKALADYDDTAEGMIEVLVGRL
jgi:hypothetical protein